MEMGQPVKETVGPSTWVTSNKKGSKKQVRGVTPKTRGLTPTENDLEVRGLTGVRFDVAPLQPRNANDLLLYFTKPPAKVGPPGSREFGGRGPGRIRFQITPLTSLGGGRENSNDIAKRNPFPSVQWRKVENKERDKNVFRPHGMKEKEGSDHRNGEGPG